MRLFGKSNKPKIIQGTIGYHNLSEWWLSTFTEEEQKYIASVMGTDWITAKFDDMGGTAARLLTAAATNFYKDTDRRLARLMLTEAERQAEIPGDILDLHFVYSQMITTYYSDRDNDPEALDTAIDACEKQIKLGPQEAEAMRKEHPDEELPSHRGFNQLRVIRDKQKDYDEAIRVCKEAIVQGWPGDWETGILKLETKRSKALKP